MRITEHGNLIQLTRLWAFNSYFVREEDGLTVVDTNLPGSAKDIQAAAARYNLPIRRIVLTHAHSDHVASADALYALVPDAEVIAAARSVPFLRGEMTLQAGEPVDELRGGYVQIETTVTREVNDGDTIGSLQVIATPGHTPGHIALFDTRDGTIIGGDAFQTQAGVAVSGKMNWLFPFPAMATWHKPTAIASAKRLLTLQPQRLAVGHGPVLSNPTAAMQKAIVQAERTL